MEQYIYIFAGIPVSNGYFGLFLVLISMNNLKACASLN
jgi:hypothetical protein